LYNCYTDSRLGEMRTEAHIVEDLSGTLEAAIEGTMEQTRNISEAEFAKAVGWHRETIARMRREGKIDHCQEGRKIWYVYPSHVIAFNHRFEKPAAA